MTTQTITTGRTTVNSRNAGDTPGIAFGRHIPHNSELTPTRNTSERSATECRRAGSNPGDGDGGDEPGGGNPGEPDDNPPHDDHPDQPDNPEDDLHNNLADAIAALARNVKSQGGGPRSKVREPDPFDRTDPTKLRTFLVQLQLSFNDHPRTFSNDRRKVDFAISYLKGIALAHFEISLIEPDLFHPPDWQDDYTDYL